MIVLQPETYRHMVFFTGAGLSAESGIPTYRGQGGIWKDYPWQEVACQDAFDRDPRRVLEFHEKRRQTVSQCEPHAGHYAIQHCAQKTTVTVITQNIDGMHQRAGTSRVLELHGSLWRLRCFEHGVFKEYGPTYSNTRCPECNRWLRPDITWMGDPLDESIFQQAIDALESCDILISVGTSGMVWPAAVLPGVAWRQGARCIEVNPEATEFSKYFHDHLREPASTALLRLLGG